MGKQTKVVSVINWKGGVGKTTLTHHIAAGLQEIHYKELGLDTYPRVLLIDADPQCNLSISCLGARKFEDFINPKSRDSTIFTIKDVFESFLMNQDIDIENETILKESVRAQDGHIYNFVDIIPSHPELIYTDMIIAKQANPNTKLNASLIETDLYKFKILNRILKSVQSEYDFIIIDCPPNLNYITQNALYASDFLLIPTIADRLSTYGMLAITNAVEKLNRDFASQEYNETKLLGIILNNIREYRGEPKSSQLIVMDTLEELFPEKIFKNYLTYGDGISRASATSYPVFALKYKFDNATKQSELLLNIIKEFVQRIKEE